MIVTRFAPSPTGLLHVGHAMSALFAYEHAVEAGGTFLLRIEDIDPVRCKEEFVQAIFEDLHWLGLHWPEPVRRQSEHMNDYKDALDQLKARGLVYPCYCTRREVEAEVARSGHAPHLDDGTLPYPGTCRALTPAQRREKEIEREPVWRLDVTKAMASVPESLTWHDRGAGTVRVDPALVGDVVLARKDVPTSYHLSVVVDDALQGVSLITRGEDLLQATHIHRLLQALLDLPTPEYHHHKLMMGPDGRRYAKRDLSATLRSFRNHMSRMDFINLLKKNNCAAYSLPEETR
ncbi:MAG: tRNA glutamyl-Q(34) synthetase GluQRS [Proteobacteria bacterium]|jgi:glutamyl-Q tRNA(Asp) synthetase|nr:tRNA glutamyl-Q(34) synthetase GluQRS [Alphaproteobacteria bacterium]NCC02928.1 tRNA glutamyl-Q(34) synthetase GluQRS [Pseudomonadota bacterium]